MVVVYGTECPIGYAQGGTMYYIVPYHIGNAGPGPYHGSWASGGLVWPSGQCLIDGRMYGVVMQGPGATTRVVPGWLVCTARWFALLHAVPHTGCLLALTSGAA